ncbi:GYF domain-containing protein [Pedosphaera parvula]|uniref:GYF domain-containing protein n=1 Tax=Pedosphaera parvula (strain Ellin514) TaxID=320771 RepID=B9XCW8_PEDPL|nr:GYF domain-containing protein [Pedosphaera parvula]EEF62314.1 hypothetical protein Cflav_PD4949 [Pedosphaera parvula Ellin514]
MEIHIRRGAQKLGAFPLEEVRTKLATGELKLDDLAWHLGLSDWIPLGALIAAATSSTSRAGKHAVPGLISSVLALTAIAGLLVTLVLLPELTRTGNTNGRGTAYVLAGMVNVYILMGTFLGIVLGIIGCFSAKFKKTWSVVGLIVNILVFATAASVMGTKGYAAFKSYQNRQTSNRYYSRPADASTGPIIFPAGATTVEDHMQLVRKWYEVKWIEAYKTVGLHDPKWDEPALKLITEASRINLGDPTTMTELERFQLAQRVLELGCKDPLVLFLCARYQMEAQAGDELFQKAAAGMKVAAYAPSVKFCWNLELAHRAQGWHRNQALLEVDNQNVALLAVMLKEKEFNKSDMSVLKDCIMEGYGANFFDRRKDAVCNTLESTPGAEPWLVHYARGVFYVKKAWEARGSGTSGSVTDEGWRGFTDNLSRAENELTQSWKLNPQDPSAATEMIAVAMGQNVDARKDMRLWFDRAVAAQIDCAGAYHSLFWGFRPRWFGSHEDMLALGRACLKTGRYDTKVPRQFLTIVKDISSEQEDDYNAIYRRPDVYRDLQMMFDNYIKEPKKARWKKYYLSNYAVVAYHADDLAQCRRCLEQLNYVYDDVALNEWNANWVPSIDKVCALTGPAREKVQQGEDAYESNQLKRAQDLFAEAEVLAKGDEHGLKFIRNRRENIGMESLLKKGDWVNFTPPADFAGWKADVGDWTVKSNNVLEVKGGVKGMMIKSLARVGPNFETKGTVEFVSSTTGDEQAGVTFGCPDLERNDWESFRIKKTKKEGQVAYFSQHFYLGEKPTKIQVLTTNTFHIQVWQGSLNAYVNGVKIISDFRPADKSGLVDYPDALVGLGGYSDQNEFVVRYCGTQLRRLTAPPTNPYAFHLSQ